MDPTTIIVNALAVGAAASFRPNMMDLREEKKVVVTAHEKLKALIGQKYGRVEAHLLDIGPASAERQQVLAQQLQQAGADKDADLLAMALALLRACYEEEPEALAAVGLGPAELEQHLFYDRFTNEQRIAEAD
jgi:hypothetical protein